MISCRHPFDEIALKFEAEAALRVSGLARQLGGASPASQTAELSVLGRMHQWPDRYVGTTLEPDSFRPLFRYKTLSRIGPEMSADKPV